MPRGVHVSCKPSWPQLINSLDGNFTCFQGIAASRKGNGTGWTLKLANDFIGTKACRLNKVAGGCWRFYKPRGFF